jgi:hypothetical protein
VGGLSIVCSCLLNFDETQTRDPPPGQMAQPPENTQVWFPAQSTQNVQTAKVASSDKRTDNGDTAAISADQYIGSSADSVHR